MDLKSIINSDSSIAPIPRPAPNQASPVNQAHQYHQQHIQQAPYISPPSTYHGRLQQPPPLQPPPHRDIRSPTRSLSHQSIQSPYTNTPTSSLNGNQYPFPHHPGQGPPHGSQGGPHHSQRDRTTTIIAPGTQPYGQPSPSTLTPTTTTPGSAYGQSQHQRPHSSHSSVTPTSAQSHMQNFPRDSPHVAHNQSNAQPPRYPNQNYQSQPGTPLGPPPMIGRPSPMLHREGSASYSYDHHRSQSVSSYVNPQGPIPSPINENPGPLAASPPPSGYNSRQPLSRSRSYRTDVDRERSLSVSPKTRLPSQTKLETLEFAQELPRVWNGIPNPAKQTVIREEPPEETTSLQSSVSSSMMQPSDKVETLAPIGSNTSLHQTTRKRRRYDEVPIYARKMGRGNPLLPNKRPTMNVLNDTNGHSRGPSNEGKLSMSQPVLDDDDFLSPWSGLLDKPPSDAVSHKVAKFICTQVFLHDDVGGPLSAAGPGGGAILEIEAKLGQLIDKNTNDRLRLPVETECVLRKGDPNLRVSFKSSMTESQHRSLNVFLNEAVTASMKPLKAGPAQPTSNSRKPMSYVHTRERDTFYELDQAGEFALPASIRALLNPHGRGAKVRITTDKATDREIAKIVKVRVADLDVYSPETPFDWRISINLEMQWLGDKRDLVEVQEGRVKAPDRNKDRMTYRHSAYQIDLTQVTPAVVTSQADKEHELEIEVSAAEVRKQAMLVREEKTNSYDALIQGFVDKVRFFARHERYKGTGQLL